MVERPVKNERGNERNAVTALRLVAGSASDQCCLVAARPLTGRWHQIRRHLNGLSHPILGDAWAACQRGDPRLMPEGLGAAPEARAASVRREPAVGRPTTSVPPGGSRQLQDQPRVARARPARWPARPAPAPARAARERCRASYRRDGAAARDGRRLLLVRDCRSGATPCQDAPPSCKHDDA